MSAPILVTAVLLAAAGHYRTPAGERPAARRPGAESILPGGRMIAPLGKQYLTGPGPFGLAISPNGKTVVTADGGPNRYSLTVLEQGRARPIVRQIIAYGKDPVEGPAKPDEDDWKSVFMGLAFESDRRIWASEGNSGRVRLMETGEGALQRMIDLNRDGYQDSYTGDCVLDRERGLLYVVDQANFRVVTIDTRRRQILSSTRVGRLPFAIALAPDGRRAFVTNLGLFEYKPIPGADPKHARETGLPFPAFGFHPPKPATASAVKPAGDRWTCRAWVIPTCAKPTRWRFSICPSRANPAWRLSSAPGCRWATVAPAEAAPPAFSPPGATSSSPTVTTTR